jgi:hypothetical protein
MVTNHRPARVAIAAVGATAAQDECGGAATQSPDPCAPLGEAVPTYEVTNVRHSGSVDNFDHGSDWLVEGRGPGQLTMSKTVEASNTFSVSMEMPAGPLSTALGFDVTESVSYTAGYEFEIPAEFPHHRWFIEAGTRDDVYVYDVQKYCAGFPSGDSERGRAKKSGHLIYQVYSKAPGTPRG